MSEKPPKPSSSRALSFWLGAVCSVLFLIVSAMPIVVWGDAGGLMWMPVNAPLSYLCDHLWGLGSSTPLQIVCVTIVNAAIWGLGIGLVAHVTLRMRA